jgi:protein-S-isoprenylcysteine O-methyltransferase Ste14
VTSGPYAYVRNPIYVAMFGMMVATGMVLTHWLFLLIACVIFAIGTFVRIRAEEKLLRAEFGAAFDDYARRVSAVIPHVW